MEDCVIHSKEKEFELPESLYKAIIENKCVLFTGAGISTETNLLPHYKFYYTIADLIDIDPDNSDISFPSLMSLFVEKHNRKVLILEIKKRFDYLKSFDKLYYYVSRFHNELSTLPFINEIITTNWDDIFECECSALPIVSDDDMIYWDINTRRVLKIHGSINNIGSIIATKEDYEKKYINFNNSITGGLLKQILATKKVVFMGYSFKDEDFISLYKEVMNNMSDFVDDHYIVTLDEDFTKKNLHKKSKIILTDATFFLKKIKEKLIADKLMINDNVYDEMEAHELCIKFEHKLTSDLFVSTRNPNLAYTLAYQDGYLDAICRMIKFKKTGQYSSIKYINDISETYNKFIKEPVFKEAYGHIANLTGYSTFLNELRDSINNHIEFKPSCYFLFGYKKQIDSIDELKRLISEKHTYHKRSYIKMEKEIRNLKDGIVIDYTPIL